MTQSHTSKARAEAIAHAQARIEQLRNYTNDVSSITEFDTTFAATNGFANSLTINGHNAQFARTENIAVVDDMKALSVRVTWTGSDGVAENVTLDTELSWEAPRSSGEVALDTDGLLKSPTGRAVIGDGYVPDGEITVDNGDGTSTYDPGDGDLRLAVGNIVVLTLKDACVSGQTCLDFAKISGKVYLDTANQNIAPGQVFVEASDAAFCQRYWVDGFGNVVEVTSATTGVDSTASGDYEFFSYTCYLGGGWHGNIGIVLGTGLSQSDKICQGDPTAVNAYQQPVIASRRAYRGMLYKIDSNTNSGREEYTDPNGNNLTRYYSTGIADSLILPGSGFPGHDFVLSRLAPSETEGTYCTTANIMTRADSNLHGIAGDLFEGVPTDFVCLNPGNVDLFDTSTFGVDTFCPYDPTDRPSMAHFLTGTVTVTAAYEFNNLLDGMFSVTSDGAGNCKLDTFSWDGTDFTARQTCIVYEWGTGWNGSITLYGNYNEFSCASTRIEYTDVTSNLSDANFDCEANSDAPGVPLNDYIVEGTFDLPPGNTSITAVDMLNGACTFDDASYSCQVSSSATSWTGTINFDSSDGFFCTVSMDNPSGVTTFVDLAPGTFIYNVSVIKANTCNI
jgi:hypothetical protein